MKLELQYSYPSDVQKVFALISDEAFRRESCEQAGATSVEVGVESDGDDRFTVRIERTIVAELPDMVKKLVGDTVSAVQVEKWGAASADGSRSAEVSVDIVGQPAQMKGTAELTPGGAGTEFTVNGDVSVKIPLIGKRIEPEVAKAITQSLDADVEYGTSKL